MGVGYESTVIYEGNSIIQALTVLTLNKHGFTQLKFLMNDAATDNKQRPAGSDGFSRY